jgi:hypothetical protein
MTYTLEFLCKEYYYMEDADEGEESPFMAMDFGAFSEALSHIGILQMNHVEDFSFIKPQGAIEIKGQYSTDLDLFYTADDAENLYRWNEDMNMEFLTICSIASGDSSVCLLTDYVGDYDEFTSCVES